jgi:hypothetical protein
MSKAAITAMLPFLFFQNFMARPPSRPVFPRTEWLKRRLKVVSEQGERIVIHVLPPAKAEGLWQKDKSLNTAAISGARPSPG